MSNSRIEHLIEQFKRLKKSPSLLDKCDLKKVTEELHLLNKLTSLQKKLLYKNPKLARYHYETGKILMDLLKLSPSYYNEKDIKNSARVNFLAALSFLKHLHHKTVDDFNLVWTPSEFNLVWKILFSLGNSYLKNKTFLTNEESKEIAEQNLACEKMASQYYQKAIAPYDPKQIFRTKIEKIEAPSKEDLLFHLANTLHELNFNDKAIQVYEYLRELYGHDLSITRRHCQETLENYEAALYQYGQTLLKENKNNKALEIYNRLIKTNPLHIKAYSDRAAIYLKLNNLLAYNEDLMALRFLQNIPTSPRHIGFFPSKIRSESGELKHDTVPRTSVEEKTLQSKKIGARMGV